MPITKTTKRPVGCDTFVAFPPATAEGTIIFGKNSDRPAGEGQSIRRYPKGNHGQEATLKCTYITIPQVAQTHAVLLSQIDWMWGAEMGANEHGVVIGNEAVWTRDNASGEPNHLLGMDLVRLGLERGSTAKEAMNVITTLLETHGQGGACAEDDPSFTYHNSYLIVDNQEAWVLETSDRHWVAQRINQGVRNISNCLSIRSDYDLASKGIEDYCRQKGYWNEASDKPFEFMRAFSGSSDDDTSDPRWCGGKRLLEKHSGQGTMNKEAMFAILRDHSSGICMHGGFETTSSWVSEISMKGSGNRHWVTGKPHPCRSDFEEAQVVSGT